MKASLGVTVAILVGLAGCSPRPVVVWPEGPLPRAPDLLPSGALGALPGAVDPGPGLVARGAALRDWAAGGR